MDASGRCWKRRVNTTSTSEKARAARELGADEMILYTEVDFEAEVERITAGEGSTWSTTEWGR
jgi:NADPH2:quinone reductase